MDRENVQEINMEELASVNGGAGKSQVVKRVSIKCPNCGRQVQEIFYANGKSVIECPWCKRFRK